MKKTMPTLHRDKVSK